MEILTIDFSCKKGLPLLYDLVCPTKEARGLKAETKQTRSRRRVVYYTIILVRRFYGKRRVHSIGRNYLLAGSGHDYAFRFCWRRSQEHSFVLLGQFRSILGS